MCAAAAASIPETRVALGYRYYRDTNTGQEMRQAVYAIATGSLAGRLKHIDSIDANSVIHRVNDLITSDKLLVSPTAPIVDADIQFIDRDGIHTASNNYRHTNQSDGHWTAIEAELLNPPPRSVVPAQAPPMHRSLSSSSSLDDLRSSHAHSLDQRPGSRSFSTPPLSDRVAHTPNASSFPFVLHMGPVVHPQQPSPASLPSSVADSPVPSPVRKATGRSSGHRRDHDIPHSPPASASSTLAARLRARADDVPVSREGMEDTRSVEERLLDLAFEFCVSPENDPEQIATYLQNLVTNETTLDIDAHRLIQNLIHKLYSTTSVSKGELIRLFSIFVLHERSLGIDIRAILALLMAVPQDRLTERHHVIQAVDALLTYGHCSTNIDDLIQEMSIAIALQSAKGLEPFEIQDLLLPQIQGHLLMIRDRNLRNTILEQCMRHIDRTFPPEIQSLLSTLLGVFKWVNLHDLREHQAVHLGNLSVIQDAFSLRIALLRFMGEPPYTKELRNDIHLLLGGDNKDKRLLDQKKYDEYTKSVFNKVKNNERDAFIGDARNRLKDRHLDLERNAAIEDLLPILCRDGRADSERETLARFFASLLICLDDVQDNDGEIQAV